MEEFLGSLYRLATTCEAHISATRLRTCALRLTLDALPNEVILYILLEYACTDYSMDLHLLVKFSHISSRIRNVILNLPFLWARIPLSLEFPAPLIAMITHRSGNLGLTVTVDAYWGAYDCGSGEVEGIGLGTDSGQASFSELLKHFDRWADVAFTIIDDYSAQYIQGHLIHVTLTSIHTLRLIDERYDQRAQLCQDWAMPHLKELDWKGENIYPLFFAAAWTLRICSLELSKPNLVDIIAFLSSTPSLTTLHLYWRTLGPSDSNKSVTQMASLLNLENLDINLHGSSSESTARLLDAILCPGLKHLSFSEFAHATYAVFAQHIRGHYPLLESYGLYMNCGDGQQVQVACFDDILLTLPSTIKKITLRGELRSSLNCGPPLKCALYPYLKDLDLEGCHSPPEDNFYVNLSNVLRRFGVTLNNFRPCARQGNYEVVPEAERIDEIATLQTVGVLGNIPPDYGNQSLMDVAAN